jgi:hypothetical protein
MSLAAGPPQSFGQLPQQSWWSAIQSPSAQLAGGGARRAEGAILLLFSSLRHCISSPPADFVDDDADDGERD